MQLWSQLSFLSLNIKHFPKGVGGNRYIAAVLPPCFVLGFFLYYDRL